MVNVMERHLLAYRGKPDRQGVQEGFPEEEVGWSTRGLNQVKGEDKFPGKLISHFPGWPCPLRGLHLDWAFSAAILFPAPSQGWKKGTPLGGRPQHWVPHPGSSVQPTVSPRSPAPTPQSGQPARRCCGSRTVWGPQMLSL